MQPLILQWQTNDPVNQISMNHTTPQTLQSFLQYLTQRDLENLAALFSDPVDWFNPGDEERAPWLGRRSSREEVRQFYRLLWAQTEPLSATIDHIFTDGEQAVISGDFSTRMLPTGKVVDSLFFIRMTIQNGLITRYRLLEDSYAVSRSLTE